VKAIGNTKNDGGMKMRDKYRKASGPLRQKWFGWKKARPNETHHLVSFGAGWNSALAFLRETGVIK